MLNFLLLLLVAVLNLVLGYGWGRQDERKTQAEKDKHSALPPQSKVGTAPRRNVDVFRTIDDSKRAYDRALSENMAERVARDDMASSFPEYEEWLFEPCCSTSQETCSIRH